MDGELPLLTFVLGIVGAAIGALGAIWAGHRQARAALESAQEQTRISERVTRLQIEASLLAAGRQQWMEKLRLELAQLFAELSKLRAAVGQPSWLQGEAALDQVTVILRLYAQVTLLLDNHDALQNELMRAISAQAADLAAGKTDDLNERAGGILHIGRKILMREEERVREMAQAGSEYLGGGSSNPAIALRPDTIGSSR